MKKIIFLEGLPGVGKSTIIRNIQSRGLSNVYAVNEIIIDIIETNINNDNQYFYMENDNFKINKYQEGIIFIDRGPISTLAYNILKEKLNDNFSKSQVVAWFDSIKNIYGDNTKVIFLKNDNNYYIPYNDDKDPYGSVDNQKQLQQISIDIIKKYVKNYEIIDYEKKDMERFINEVIN